MKTLSLGSETGSLINHVISGTTNLAPAVGMGVTILGWSDRHAATIVEVSPDGKRVGIVRDVATRTDSNGMSESQSYSFTPGTGNPSFYTLRKNGRWVAQGEAMKGGSIKIGTRDEYYDHSF